MFTISPSLYSADLLDLREVIGELKGFEHLHLDIDDGNFVRGISFGMEVVKGVAECTEIPLDAHLEVLNPMEYVEPLCEAGVEMICAHVESLDFPSLFLGSVHQYGKKAGLALNVKTPIEFIEPYVDRIEQLILVSCEADAEGLKFQTGVLKKISKARKILGKNTRIWVDGGINEDNLKDVIVAGADGVVIGRAVFGSNNPSESYARLLALGRKYEKGVIKNEI
ncbi:MAG: ribulose-phosphate 3-epimerase [Mediterraneibacter faecis]|nr:ribulose-phosphate 3-epimerase [Mediterraneibacter faecis]